MTDMDRPDRETGNRLGAVDDIVGLLPGAAVVLAAVFVLPQSPDSFEGPRRLVWGALAVVLAAVGLLRRDRRGDAFRCETAAGAALLAWMLARSLAVGSFWRVAAPFVAWTTPLLLFLVAARWAWDATSRGLFVRTISILGLAEAGLMLLQRFGFDPLFGEATRSLSYAPGRMIGTIGYQNQAAEFLGVALCCVPAAWTDRRSRIPAILLLVAAIVLSSNRGALLALAVVGVPWLLRAVRGHCRRSGAARFGVSVRVGAALLVVAVALASVPELRSRMGELRAPSRSHGVQSRVWMSRVALSLAKERPVFGCGAGGYAWEYVDRLGALLPERKEHEQLKALVWAREAHCDPLQFWAEFGLVGVALALVFIVSAARAVLATATAGPAAAAAFLTICSLFSFSWQTSFAAPAAGLLLGMAVGGGRAERRRASGAAAPKRRAVPPSAVVAAAAAMLAFFVPVAETLVSIDLDEAYWDCVDGRPSKFLKGRWLAEGAKLALGYGQPLQAAEMCALASEAWMSPELLATSATALEAAGHGEEAADVWLRLARCGLRHGEALKGLSLCRERGKRFREAADAEAERFRLWPQSFSDGELFRLCALSLLSGNASRAEHLSRKFRDRCRGLGERDRRWTPAWENLRGGALLALGRREEARACFESALRRDPGLQSARRNLDSMK